MTINFFEMIDLSRGTQGVLARLTDKEAARLVCHRPEAVCLVVDDNEAQRWNDLSCADRTIFNAWWTCRYALQ